MGIVSALAAALGRPQQPPQGDAHGEESGPAYRQDLADLLHIGPRQCGLILKHMVEDGRLVQVGQRYCLPAGKTVSL